MKKNEQKSTANKKNRKQKMLFQAVIYIICIVLIVLAMLTIELRPVRQVPVMADVMDTVILTQFTGKVFNSVQMAKTNKLDFCTIHLQEKELNAFARMLLRLWGSKKKASAPDIYAFWQDGKANLEISKKYAGVYFTLRINLTPEVRDGKLYMYVSSCHLGKIPLSPGYAEKLIAEEINKQHTKDRRMQKMLQLIYRLQVNEDGDLQLILPRKKAAKLVLSLL